AHGSPRPSRDCGSPPRALCPARETSYLDPPDSGLRELEAIAGRVAEIDRAPAAWPFEIRLDRDALICEARLPALDLVCAGRKADMTFANRPMWRHRQRAGGRCNARRLRIEDQEHLALEAVEHVPALGLAERREPEHALVEGLDRTEVP